MPLSLIDTIGIYGNAHKMSHLFHVKKGELPGRTRTFIVFYISLENVHGVYA